MNFAQRVVILLTTAILLVVGESYAQLSGILDIGTAPSNYTSIGAAVADLNSQGISAPVSFRIKTGTYNERVTITHFPRTGGATDAVTFRPFPAATVTWQYTAAGSSTNWVVKTDSAKYITFSGLDFVAAEPTETYGRLVVIANGSNTITVRGCTLTGFIGDKGTAASLAVIDGTGGPAIPAFALFEENTFSGGYRAIDANPTFGTSFSSSTTIIGNTFSGQYRGAISLTEDQNSLVDSNSVFDAAWSSPSYTGINNSSGGADITRNTLDLQKGINGIWMNADVAAIAIEGEISNNMIAMRVAGASRGIFLAAHNIDVYHNSVRMRVDGYPLWVADGFQDNDVFNNILFSDGGDVAMRVDSPVSVDSSDYNILYSTGSNVVSWDGTAYADIPSYRAASGQDDLSYNAPVTFVDTVGPHDLHLAAPSTTNINLVALEVGGITKDIDGDTRGSNTVTRGADEGALDLLPLDNADTGSGYYTAGGASPDFVDATTAIRNLNIRGIKGNVTFRIRPGTYSVNETINFTNHVLPSAMAKTASTDTVLFRAGNPANRPTLQHAATTSGNNYVIKIDEMDRIRFWNVDFTANGTPPYGRIIELDGNVHEFVLAECSLTGLAGQTASSAALVYGNHSFQNDNIVSGCDVSGGSHGVYLSDPPADSGPRGSGTLILNNNFVDQASGAIFTNHRIEITGNDVTSTRANIIGIELDGAKPDVIGNSIHVTGASAIGLRLIRSNGSTFDLAQVTNNFISATDVGLKLDLNAHLFGIYHNTIRAGGHALRIESTALGGTEILNNILVNTSTGTALYVADAADVDTTDFNNLTDAGGTLVHWNGVNYATLSSYKIASGQDLHSSGVTPDFVNAGNGNLHLTATSIGNANFSGIPLAEVTDDIDGDIRSPVIPYMGADEPSIPIVIVVEARIFLEGPFSGSLMDTTLKAAGVLPSTQPFNTAPWFWGGSESASQIPNGAVDWVLVDVRATASGSSLVGRRAGFLLQDGTVVDTTGGPIGIFAVPPGDYYIVVWHRNHIGAMSAIKATLGTTTSAYDFTAPGMGYTLGPAPMKDLGGGMYGLFSGDANLDGQITAADFNAWLVDTKAVATGYLSTDFNMDGQATASDFNLWLSNTKAVATSQVP